ncbi:hypothetical protein AA13595_3233 [Gluconacetobacter johannae DSM 13595]|nr:hypothetical protein AA13595_3233 [Gluconacetobacter johannae DSM 13595]
MGRSPIMARGLPGSRVEAMRAGMTTIGFMREAGPQVGSGGNDPDDGTAGADMGIPPLRDNPAMLHTRRAAV